MSKKSFLMTIMGTFICAFSFNIFLSPYKIIPGGVSGLAIIFNRLFNVSESLIIAILSIFLLLLGYLMLGKKEVYKALFGSIFFSLFAYLSSIILSYVNFSIDNRLLATVVGGVFYGFGIGLVFKEGYTTGGGDILAKIVNKYFHLNMGIGVFIIDFLIAILGAFIFDFETLIYSIVNIYIYSAVIDKVMLGISGSKSFYIITNNPKEIKEYIVNELHHGVTSLKAVGAYSKDDKYVLLTVIPTRDYYKLKDALDRYDKDAFFFVSNSYEVEGGK